MKKGGGMMRRRKLIPILILVLVMALALTSMAAVREPVENSRQFQVSERGPGVNCGICNGEPLARERQYQENRKLEMNQMRNERKELAEGEGGNFLQEQQGNQKNLQRQGK